MKIKIFILTLAIIAIATTISNTMLTLLLVEISSTFGVNEGITVQLRTVNAVAEVVFGLLLGFIYTWFKNKAVLILGISLVTISAIGSYLSPSLTIMLFFSFLEGTGSVFVTIASFTLIGELLPSDQKNKAVSWVVAAGFIFTFIGVPTINLIADVGTWRQVFLLLVLPVSLVGLTLAIFETKNSKITKKLQPLQKKNWTQRLKEVFLNKSSLFCLIAGLFFSGLTVGVFAIAFYRQQFLMPREYAVYILLAIGAIATAGSLIPSKIGQRYKCKSITVNSIFLSGITTLLLFLSPTLEIAVCFNFLAAFFISTSISAYQCYILEQAPKSRSTMISFYRLFISTGAVIAPAIGGFLLALFSQISIDAGYKAVGIGLGTLSIISATIIYLFTEEQITQKDENTQNIRNRIQPN